MQVQEAAARDMVTHPGVPLQLHILGCRVPFDRFVSCGFCHASRLHAGRSAMGIGRVVAEGLVRGELDWAKLHILNTLRWLVSLEVRTLDALVSVGSLYKSTHVDVHRT